MEHAPFHGLLAMDYSTGVTISYRRMPVRDMGSPAGAPHDMAPALQEYGSHRRWSRDRRSPFPRDAFKLPPQGEPMGGAKQSGLGRGGIRKAFHGNGRGWGYVEGAHEARRSRTSSGGRVLDAGGVRPPARPPRGRGGVMGASAGPPAPP